jgi:hypothetical protein
MAVVTADHTMFNSLMNYFNGLADMDVAMHHLQLSLHRTKCTPLGPWPEGWLRCLPFVRLLVQNATDAYDHLPQAARADREVALFALQHRSHNTHLNVPPPLRHDEDFWLEALCTHRIDYEDLPIEWQWDVAFMLRVLRGPPLPLECTLCSPERWPHLDSEELLMELMWSCSDSNVDFWRYVTPARMFMQSRSPQLWAVAVRTTRCADRMTQIAACMGPSEKAFFRAISWRRQPLLSWLPFGSWLLC